MKVLIAPVSIFHTNGVPCIKPLTIIPGLPLTITPDSAITGVESMCASSSKSVCVFPIAVLGLCCAPNSTEAWPTASASSGLTAVFHYVDYIVRLGFRSNQSV